ncbi:hypothetical protein [Salinibacillus xinjiangensis]|uniref:Prenyltransferase n=1 Tax=Salinibacillus xinjiangensis TaxID=1229268 RepID=A0A6G1X569_9BACI|nr:hypothetical protein [Salinibacillus xinjiangensis]MRG86069.1 hypothetical protein [Salinibacillus xinjiangensis]
MRKLSKQAFQGATNWILKNGRPLEQATIKHSFMDGTTESILNALEKYQNENGGFGHGLEADFRLPDSSSLATTVAMQHLIHFGQLEKADEMITKAIQYFEQSYNEKRGGWYAVPEAVNDYPHAFWWTVHEDGMSWIDHNWGNPSAEIIGYLVKYQTKVQQLDVKKLLDQAINHLLSLEKFESEHEIYCYIRLFHLCPEYETAKVKQQLERAATSLVQYESSKWKEYVPSPLKFVHTPGGNSYGIPLEEVNKNLNYLVEQLETNGVLKPNWEWNDNLDVWEQAKEEWTGVLTLDTLETLRRFGRID